MKNEKEKLKKQIDTTKSQQRKTIAIVDIFYSLVFLSWIILPIILKSLKKEAYCFFSPIELPKLAGSLIGSGILWAFLGLLGAIALFKCVSPFFLKKLPALLRPGRSLPLLHSVILSLGVFIIYLLNVFAHASRPSWFLHISLAEYIYFGLTIVYNAAFLIIIIRSLSKKNPAYQDYLAYRIKGSGKKRLLDFVLNRGIQRRLFVSFVPLIVAIILIISFLTITNFQKTMVDSIIQNGLSLAERTANVIRSNPGDSIMIEDYLSSESKNNIRAETKIPFIGITYYLRSPDGKGFRAQSSTNIGKNGQEYGAAYIDAKEADYQFDEVLHQYEFRAPVRLSGRSIGFVQVLYDRDTVFEPFFRTLIRVISIAFIAIYLSIFLTYLIGRNIVLPILFLRLSVSSISDILSSMIKGETKISSELLKYQDRVLTKDEIKSLSHEVGNMTQVIRGIVPYISASTLRSADKTGPSSELRELCFLFTDIRGFTTMCEGLSPQEVVEVLNRYLDLQSSIIMKHQGDVDKFVGDEVMAMFEGKDKELKAVRCALEIREEMKAERDRALAEGKSVVSIGIGINTGPVVFGSVGARDRMDFTSIGDTVNLAARLEGANKAYATDSLISEAVWEKVSGEFLCREIDLLTVKGKSEPVRIYEVLKSLDQVKAEDEKLVKDWETALKRYRDRKWAMAEKSFAKIAESYQDEAAEVFIERIQLFKQNPPPPRWDGVFKLSVK